MKKDNLIIKWLDNNLNEEELRAFKQLDASSDFIKIDAAAKKFKAPDFDVDANLATLLSKKPSIQNIGTPWKKYVASIAAIFVVSIGLYFSFLHNTPEMLIALQAERSEGILPDNSEVFLNAGSSIVYEKDDWSENRSLRLEGEAYFKVTKGTTFTVNTDQGSVTVLGTQFTVNDRSDYFEVVCFEGLVRVDYQDESIELPAGNSIKIYHGKLVKDAIPLTEPTWIHKKSLFKSVPFTEAVDELKRQYGIEVTFENNLEHTLYTGSFTHEKLETALEAITIPLNLSYEIKGKNVVLKSK